MRTHSALVAACIVACSVIPSGPVQAREVSGVAVPESTTAFGKTLALNGAGMRRKFIINVYVGALYLESPATSLKDIVGANQTWSVRMHFVRKVSREQVLGAFKEGFEKNSRDQVARLTPGLDKLSAAMTDLQPGDEMVISYAPGKGTLAGIQGKAQVAVEGQEFGEALLRNWLGSEPADGGLKRAMLGGK
jgi:hypothetical protein